MREQDLGDGHVLIHTCHLCNAKVPLVEGVGGIASETGVWLRRDCLRDLRTVLRVDALSLNGWSGSGGELLPVPSSANG